MLRDGLTGDWIGTFLGHKGAVWASRLSADASLAVTGSADFTARVWDTFTGECVAKIPEAHIVRAVALSPDNTRVATGGMEKKVKIWGLGQTGAEKEVKDFTEVGKGCHAGTVKSLVWTEVGLVSACDDKTIRWWDVRSPERPVAEYVVDGTIGSCELNADLGGNGGPGVLSVAAGKNVYIFDAGTPGKLIKRVRMPSETASVAVNQATGRFVTGSSADTWVRVWDLETEEELGELQSYTVSWITPY